MKQKRKKKDAFTVLQYKALPSLGMLWTEDKSKFFNSH